MNIFPRVFCWAVASWNSRVSLPRILIYSPVPSPYCLALHTRTGPPCTEWHRTVQDSIFTELPSVDPFHLVHSHSTLPASRRNSLPFIVVRRALVILTLVQIISYFSTSSRYIPLPVALCPMRDSCHGRSYRIHSVTFWNLPRLFTSLARDLKFSRGHASEGIISRSAFYGRKRNITSFIKQDPSRLTMETRCI